MYRRPTLWQRIGDLATRLAVQEVAQATQELASSTSGLPVAAFRAFRNAALNATGSAQAITMDVEQFDTASEYDPATGIFTPAYSGVYLLSAGVGYTTVQADGTQMGLTIEKDGYGTIRYLYRNKIGGAIDPQLSGADLIQVAAGDHYNVSASGAAAASHFLASDAATWFSGLLVALT